MFWLLLLPRISCVVLRLYLEELVLWFSPLLHDCVLPCLCLEESCCFDQLRGAVALVLGDQSLLVRIMEPSLVDLAYSN